MWKFCIFFVISESISITVLSFIYSIDQVFNISFLFDRKSFMNAISMDSRMFKVVLIHSSHQQRSQVSSLISPISILLCPTSQRSVSFEHIVHLNRTSSSFRQNHIEWRILFTTVSSCWLSLGCLFL